jgi:predicted NAD/FAD-binding protein
VKIAVIGGGVAGLSTAWMLDGEHEVVLFEETERLGGSAHTVHLQRGPETVPVDLGAQFFTAELYPWFLRLLRVLGLACRPALGALTLFRRDLPRPLLPGLPPDRESFRQWPRLADPRVLERLFHIGRALRFAAKVERARDWSLTVGDLTRELRLPRAIARDVIHPFFNVFCGPILDDIENVSLRAAALYPLRQAPRFGRQLGSLELPGGMGSYFPTLAATLRQTTLRHGCAVEAIARDARGLVVASASGRERFERVVLAAPAWQAVRLLEAGPLRDVLSRFEYMPTASYIHSDTRLLPPRRSDWAPINQLVERPACKLTMWIGRPRRDDLFKTLTDDVSPPPSDLHIQRAFQHPIMNARYFEAQAALTALQGRDGVFVAGSYTNGFEMHESGLLSAIAVAERLAPSSENLSRLRRTSPEPLLETTPDARVFA